MGGMAAAEALALGEVAGAAKTVYDAVSGAIKVFSEVIKSSGPGGLALATPGGPTLSGALEAAPAAATIGETAKIGTQAISASDVPLSFESRRSEGKGESQKVGAPKEVEQKERIVSSKEEVSDFIRGKIDSGVCEKDRYVDGRQTYKVVKQEGNLNKGDLLTKDTLHNEVELWTQNGVHKGAIEPKRGILYKSADSTKYLNTK
jgi:hypothetical protein